MKFVALALTLLLAVGSQAASLMADAPSDLNHIRAVVDTYMESAKESAQKALGALEEPEYNDMKLRVSASLDNIHNQIKAWQAQVSPVTDSVVSTLADATAELRASIQKDFENLDATTGPMRENLKTVVRKHIDEYRTLMEPILKEYHENNRQAMEALKIKMEPMSMKLRESIATNVEETKAALMPIVEEVRKKINDNIENVKKLVTPYVEDYKEQITDAFNQAKGITAEDLGNLKQTIAPELEVIKEKFNSILQAIAATFMKN